MKHLITALLLLATVSAIPVNLAVRNIREQYIRHYTVLPSAVFDSVPTAELPIILSICQVESRFSPLARNHHDYGLMQINRCWFPQVLKDWLNPTYNVSVGYQIYRDCLERSGSVYGALCLYNGDKSGHYARKVLRGV
jgi:soluble lytic murein transglycosylase-like protein